MTGAAKRKGGQGEREFTALVTDLTGCLVRRKLGAGRADDISDLDGIPSTTAQVAHWVNVARAAREKPLGAEQQRLNAGEPFAATFVRFRGGTWRVVMTVEHWAALTREALA